MIDLMKEHVVTLRKGARLVVSARDGKKTVVFS